MEAKNLRIGNFVRAKSPEKTEWVEAHKISAHTLYSMEYPTAMDFVKPDMEPIPLTREWLDKFGLLEGIELGQHFYYINLPFTLTRKQKTGDTRGQFIANVEFVHELQNLFFALTGSELKLKELV